VGRTVTRCLSVAALLLVLLPSVVSAQQPCGFALGFKAIVDQIGDRVGRCLENEHFNVANGNAEQRTAAWHGQGGLLVWRKSDNWTGFTDGYRTWVNGPYGLQQRLNTERFAWEADSAAPPALVAVRAAGHPRFDRVVFEFRGGLSGHAVAYTAPPILADGSGLPVAVAGDAFLAVRFSPAVAHDESGQPTTATRALAPSLATLVELKQTGDFEAVVSWALGLRRRAAFTVYELANPPRVVIDIARP
jgi:hypothetical protein